jgi:predicted hotdog family 3-hydroxylacyl-ACP dehydratase
MTPACFTLSALGDGRFAVEVPGDSPLYAGHFPGRPMLPGICHLAFVTEALGGRAPDEIAFLKLRRQVSGAARLTLTLDGSDADGKVRFGTAQDGETVAHGTLRLAPSDRQEPDLQPAGREGEPIGDSIPHRPPARLVAGRLEVRDQGILCVAAIPSGHPLAALGRAPAFLALEAGAQAAAVFEAGQRDAATGPRIGYLVGLRDARLAIARLPVDVPFVVTAELIGSAPPLAQYRIDLDGLVSGTVSTFLVT